MSKSLFNLLVTVVALGGAVSSAHAELSSAPEMTVIIRANHGTTSGYERTERAKFCLTNVFLPGEYGDNDEIWLELMTSAGSSFMPFPGGAGWWRHEPAQARLEFRFEAEKEKEYIAYTYDPRTLKFTSAFVRNSRTGSDGLTCGF